MPVLPQHGLSRELGQLSKTVCKPSVLFTGANNGDKRRLCGPPQLTTPTQESFLDDLGAYVQGNKMLYQIEPKAKPRMARSDKWKQRPIVMAYRAYKDRLRELNVQIPEGAKIIFHIPLPKSWSQKKRAKYLGKPHQQTPDLDNLIKGLWDALCTQDSQIWQVDAEKRWAEFPAIEVVVRFG